MTVFLRMSIFFLNPHEKDSDKKCNGFHLTPPPGKAERRVWSKRHTCISCILEI